MHQYSILVASIGVLVALLTSSVAINVETTNLCPSDASPKMRQLCLLASLEQFLVENPPHSNGTYLKIYFKGNPKSVCQQPNLWTRNCMTVERRDKTSTMYFYVLDDGLDYNKNLLNSSAYFLYKYFALSVVAFTKKLKGK